MRNQLYSIKSDLKETDKNIKEYHLLHTYFLISSFNFYKGDYIRNKSLSAFSNIFMS